MELKRHEITSHLGTFYRHRYKGKPVSYRTIAQFAYKITLVTFNGLDVTKEVLAEAKRRYPNESPRMSLGEKVIQFDKAEDNSLKAFNALFGTNVEGSPDDDVEIGNPAPNGGRELFIDGKKTQVFFDKYDSDYTLYVKSGYQSESNWFGVLNWLG